MIAVKQEKVHDFRMYMQHEHPLLLLRSFFFSKSQMSIRLFQNARNKKRQNHELSFVLYANIRSKINNRDRLMVLLIIARLNVR